MKLVYLAGPMSDNAVYTYVDHNFAAFDAAKAFLLTKGFDVINPADLTRALRKKDPTADAKGYATFIRADNTALLVVQGIALLPDWEYSRGAKWEVMTGQLLGLDFYDATTGEPMEVPEVKTYVSGEFQHLRNPFADRTVMA
jgi:hypothetical protein